MEQKTGPNNRLKVILVESLDELAQHAEQYDRLLSKAGDSLFPVYDRFWMEQSKSIYLKSGATLFFLLAYRANKLVGVAPFQLEKRSLVFSDLKRLRFWGQNCGSTMFENMTGDFIINNDSDRRQCMAAFLEFLKQDIADRWDLFSLGMLCEKSKNLLIFDEYFEPQERTQSEMPSYFVDLSNGWDGFFSSLSRKTRYNYRRRLRKLNNHDGEHEFVCHETVSEALIEELAVLHTMRQQELIDSGYSRDAVLGNPANKQISRGYFKTWQRRAEFEYIVYLLTTK